MAPCDPVGVEVEWRRAAVYVVGRDPAGRLLLTRFVQPGNPDSGSWTMPGGGLEAGEDPRQDEIDRARAFANLAPTP